MSTLHTFSAKLGDYIGRHSGVSPKANREFRAAKNEVKSKASTSFEIDEINANFLRVQKSKLQKHEERSAEPRSCVQTIQAHFHAARSRNAVKKAKKLPQREFDFELIQRKILDRQAKLGAPITFYGDGTP